MQDQKKKTDAGKYEAKYRDLKESFRLYRKKAKEIFMAQQQGETGFMPTLHDSGAEGAKISYLKNLMVNYLGSDAACREHMEPAIATVLNFTEDDLSRIKQQKEQNESWF
uniref:GRIP domain-containing protein n=1 Tax=Skeletonema marinoi TaxID=267567 RepID=A0A7S2P5H9_9STRA